MSTIYSAQIWILSNDIPVILIEKITKECLSLSITKTRYTEDKVDTTILKFESQDKEKVESIVKLSEIEYEDTLYQAVVYRERTTKEIKKVIHTIGKDYIPTS